MDKRRLGNSSLAIAPIMFGGNVFGWTADEATSFALLDAFVAAGFNAIDTADVYSVWVPGHAGGESEATIGRWLKARGGRDKVVIATKVGMEMAPDRQGLKPDYIRTSVEASLQRLQTDYIDLYQSHKDDETVPLEETLGAYARLIEEGKVRAIGASNYSAPRLRAALDVAKAHGLPRYETLQPLYNLYDRHEFEGPLAELCLAENVGVINFFSLASGFLTGKYRSEADLSKSVRGPRRVKAYLDDKGYRILAALDQVAARTGATPTQIAIAWLIGKPAVTAPIASATSVAQLEELLKAASLTLDGEAMATLDAAGA
ncbi:MAG: aldo/keto reductase [Alphaproteobacteria bacterium]|jgi:aryl-alcohol dehydrogenase-like predicted oxidoreductase|nr:aldo/keto reductase [Alphaproteobacteria bacterium]